MRDRRGGYIGNATGPATTGLNSSAVGIWTLREAEALRRAGTWPRLFTPTDVSGIQLWLDGADASTMYDATSGGSLVAADGGVARWEDKSGNGKHATQSTSSRRPTRKASLINGRDTLQFDGTEDQFSVNGNVFEFGSADFAVFAVARSNTASGADVNDLRIMLCMQGNDNGQSGILRVELQFGKWQISSRTTGTGPGSTADTATYTANTLTVITADRNGSTLTGRKNGVSFGTRTISGSITRTGEASPPPLAVGSFDSNPNYGDSLSFYWSGEICEVIVYHASLSTENRERVESYLMSKWGAS